MLHRIESYDERCSRIDTELRATEVRWPLGKSLTIAALIALSFWLIIWAGYEIVIRVV